MEHTDGTIRVLHVEDDPEFADLTATFLEREDERFEVTTATSASAGIERLVAERIDCVVSDHDMPGTTGIEFLETVRAEQPDLPFILFTGKGSEEVASEAISRGVTDYLQKAGGAEQYAILANRICNAVESNRAERAVERTRSQFEAIADHSMDAIVTIDTESRIRFANPAVEDLFGYKPGELEGEPLLSIMPERYHESHLSAIDEYVETDERTIGWSNVEFPAEHRDGTEIPVSVSFGEFEQAGEKRFIGIMRDISDTPTYGGQDPAFLEALVETIGVGVAAYDETGTVTYVNEQFAENLGTDKERLEGTAVWEINPDLDRERFDAYWASFDPGETRTAEATHAFEGTELPVETVTTCATIGGTPYHFGTVRDISEDLAQEERFQAFVEQSNDVLSVLDRSGVYQYQSPASRRVLGYDPQELIGETAFSRIHPDDRERVFATFQQALEDPDQGLVVEYRFKHADGSWIWLESRGLSRPEETDIEGLVVNSREVTERKEHERQIADLHDATREMMQAGDERAVADVVVETAESVLGHPITGVWLADADGTKLEPVAPTEAAQELLGDLPTFTEGNSLSWHAYDEGETIIVDDVASEPDAYDSDGTIRSVLVLPLGAYGVLLVGSRQPDTFDDNDVALAKLLAANAQVAFGRSERQRLLERQTDRMEFFNSILRHDVLNAVTVIRARAEFLEEALAGEQRQDAETIIRWSDNVQEIVQRVRTVLETLTGEGDPQIEPVDLVSALEEQVERVRATYPDVQFEVDAPESAPVLANEMLGDVLGNLVTNAVEHNDPEGLRISATVEAGDDEVTVRIADNGTGIEDERKGAILRRGETGHAKSVGSGFGLFFVDSMVSEYGGEVDVEDNAEGGATFVITLPAAGVGLV